MTVAFGVLISMKQSTERNYVVTSDTGLVDAKNYLSYSGQSRSKDAVRVSN
jgi:hypothetical protein